MKRMRIHELLPGMVLAEDVLNYNNQMVLAKGTVLSDKTIINLEFYSIYSVRIEDIPEAAAASAPPSDDRISYADHVRSTPEYRQFKQEFDNEMDSLKNFTNDIINHNASADFRKMLDDTLALLNTGGSKVQVFDMLHCMRAYDDLTYAHCISVALMCNVFAEWLKMSEEDVRIATLCGLCHDIGKLSIPNDIICKPGKLTDAEYSIIQTHPLEGYKLLSPYPIDERIKQAALLHHERCDGSGYPGHLKGNQVNQFAQLVSIADVYDAMTSARIYRGSICPFTVVGLMESEGLQKYDPKLITTFLGHIMDTYLLNSVQLNDGTIGKIIYINRNKLSRPTIKSGDTFIDLAKHPELSIETLV